MSVLGHILESEGLATVGISLVRPHAERVRPPRVLHCEFPLGRPLGRPHDTALQHDVLARALGLVARTDVPVLEDHPEVITDESAEPLACALPPRFDPSLPPPVDEVLGLRAAYDRQFAASGGRTLLGRVADADGMADLVARVVRVVDGASLEDEGFDGTGIVAASQDVRAYFEEAALALSEEVPAARRAETWFYTRTETGALLLALRGALKDRGVDRGVWGYVAPSTQR
ncbi:MAG: hypothetical protein S0880_19995 [Actinomycetota bacterium]|nr:hypothetical protein [Actinomycetota bacterium]